jgi:hypothetical protein
MSWAMDSDSCSLLCVQQLGLLDSERNRDGLMAEVIAFLLSARASLESLSRASSSDSQAEGFLVSISGQIAEVLSALDDFNTAQWVDAESRAAIGRAFAYLPTSTMCLDGLTCGCRNPIHVTRPGDIHGRLRRGDLCARPMKD